MESVIVKYKLLSAEGVAFWLGRWICNPEVPGSNSPACQMLDLCLVGPNSTPNSIILIL